MSSLTAAVSGACCEVQRYQDSCGRCYGLQIQTTLPCCSNGSKDCFVQCSSWISLPELGSCYERPFQHHHRQSQHPRPLIWRILWGQVGPQWSSRYSLLAYPCWDAYQLRYYLDAKKALGRCNPSRSRLLPCPVAISSHLVALSGLDCPLHLASSEL